MNGGYFGEAFIFLVRTIFDLCILAVALRFLLQLVRADFYNPISQFLVKITNPLLRPLRRVIPGFGGVDWASLVLMLVLKAGEISLITLIGSGRIPALTGLLIFSLAQLLNLFVYIFIVAILVQVILSWVNPGGYSPSTVILYRLTEPLLRPARQLLPPIGGLDLSPIIVLVVLQLTIILVINPIMHLGVSWAGTGISP
jgi:YggT family protein